MITINYIMKVLLYVVIVLYANISYAEDLNNQVNAYFSGNVPATIRKNNLYKKMDILRFAVENTKKGITITDKYTGTYTLSFRYTVPMPAALEEGYRINLEAFDDSAFKNVPYYEDENIEGGCSLLKVKKMQSGTKLSFPCRITFNKKDVMDYSKLRVSVIKDGIDSKTPPLAFIKPGLTFNMVKSSDDSGQDTLELENIYNEEITIGAIEGDKHINITNTDVYKNKNVSKNEKITIIFTLADEALAMRDDTIGNIKIKYRVDNEDLTCIIAIQIADVTHNVEKCVEYSSKVCSFIIEQELKKAANLAKIKDEKPSSDASAQDIEVTPFINMTSPNSGTYTLSVKNISKDKDKITIMDVTSSADCIKPCNIPMYAILWANQEKEFKFNLNVPPTDCDAKISINYKIGNSGEIKTVSVPIIKFIHHEEVASGNNKEIISDHNKGAASNSSNNYSWGWYVIPGVLTVVVCVASYFLVIRHVAHDNIAHNHDINVLGGHPDNPIILE